MHYYFIRVIFTEKWGSRVKRIEKSTALEWRSERKFGHSIVGRISKVPIPCKLRSTPKWITRFCTVIFANFVYTIRYPYIESRQTVLKLLLSRLLKMTIRYLRIKKKQKLCLDEIKKKKNSSETVSLENRVERFGRHCV